MASIRAVVETAFLSRPDATIASMQLVGTVVLDDRRLVVVLRETQTGGELHRIVNDVEDLLGDVPAEARDRLLDDWMDGVLIYPSYRVYRGRDRWGVHHWDDPVDDDEP